MEEPHGVQVLDFWSWADDPAGLAYLLRQIEPSADRPIRPMTSSNRPESAVLTAPGYWSAHPRELSDALGGSDRLGSDRAASSAGAGAAPSGGDRLTMTVEEAAQALGISRALAYEAVHTGDIPSIHIGKRILVPRAALKRMLDAAGGGQHSQGS